MSKVKLIQFSDGQQAMVSGDNPQNISVTIDDATVTEERMREVSDAQQEEVAAIVDDNKLDFDTMKENTTIMNEKQTTTSVETEKSND